MGSLEAQTFSQKLQIAVGVGLTAANAWAAPPSILFNTPHETRGLSLVDSVYELESSNFSDLDETRWSQLSMNVFEDVFYIEGLDKFPVSPFEASFDQQSFGVNELIGNIHTTRRIPLEFASWELLAAGQITILDPTPHTPGLYQYVIATVEFDHIRLEHFAWRIPEEDFSSPRPVFIPSPGACGVLLAASAYSLRRRRR